MRWTVLVLLISLSATLAAPAAKKAKAKKGAPTCACPQPKVSEIEAAEGFYQRGNTAQAMSNATFAEWIKTHRVPRFDSSTDRWIYAVDMFANATRYNPAHWRAHRRLGLLLANAQGTHNYDTLTVMHLVAYLALAPEDDFAAQSKRLVDARLASIIAYNALAKIRGEHDLDPVMATQMTTDRAKSAYLAVARRLTDLAKTQTELEYFARGVPSMFSEQVLFNHDMAKRILERNAAAAASAGGGMGGPGGPEGAGGAPTSAGGAAPGGPGVVGGGASPTLAATATEAEVYLDLGRACAYVPEYLAMIGGMQRFMDYLEYYKIDYDPRPCQMLIGEAIVQLRLLFTRGHVAGTGALRAEYKAIAEKGPVSTLHFWTNRDFRRQLPDYMMDSGKMPKTDLVEKQYRASMQTEVVRPPVYLKAEDRTEDMAKEVARINLSTVESQISFLVWRHIDLWRNRRFAGQTDADDDFLAYYAGVGTGKMSDWVFGPLPRRETKVAANAEDRRWLMTAAR